MEHPARSLALLRPAVTVLASRGVAYSQAIRLGDVAAGGEGTGPAPAVNTGVDERTGRFTTDFFDGPVSMGDALDEGESDSFVRADANGDPKLDISDAVTVLNYLFLGDAAPDCLDAADTNDDGELTSQTGSASSSAPLRRRAAPPGATPGLW
jgi:hypothetical protein